MRAYADCERCGWHACHEYGWMADRLANDHSESTGHHTVVR